jgi:perosamine synthetase
VIPLVAPCITEEDRRYLTSRIAGDLLENDNEVARFENAFATNVGRAGGVAVNSGTSALQLALHAVGVRPSDEVVIPSYTCVALLNAVNHCGATAVFVDNEHDVRRAHYAVDPDATRRALTARTRAVIVSHMFGSIAHMDADLGVPIIEDFTLSLGAVAGGRPCGTFGEIGVCSLHESKMISTGRGGILVADDPVVLDEARRLADYDAAVPLWRFEQSASLAGQFTPAFSFAMTATQAALGMSQLSQLGSFIDRRLSLAARYTARFREAGIECPDVPDDRSNVFFRYLIQVSKPVRDVLSELRTAGIEAGRGVFPPLHVLVARADSDFPGASWCVDNLISVPVHPSLTDDQADYIAAAVISAFAG